jgi:adenosylcobinamide-GDP ribazoletransferase
VRDGIRSAIAALGFLTAVPVGRSAAIAETDLRRSVVLFPVVGALVGGTVGLVGWGASALLPPVVAAVLAVGGWALVTGLLHLDGLADAADGVGAALAGREAREVMSDPRVGTFGICAVVLDLLLRTSVVAAFLSEVRFPWELVGAGAIGRASVIALALWVPSAAPVGGTGSWMRSLDRRRCLAGLGSAAALAILATGARSVAIAGAAALVCVVVGRWSARHLGGMRGDTFGAAVELTETFGLVAALAAA